MAARRLRRDRRRAHDVAIYAPGATYFYSQRGQPNGGAELQTTMLASGLARAGLRVAHVVYTVDEPRPLEPPAPTVVERGRWLPPKRTRPLVEAAAIWRALRRADAHVYIVRGSGGHLGAAAAFSRAYGRSFVFSSSSDLDFDFERSDRHRRTLAANRLSIRAADTVVVQTCQQQELARDALDGTEAVIIPSFAELAEQASGEPDYFLWANRLVGYKLPERYVELAKALPEARFRMIAGTTNETPPELRTQLEEASSGVANLEVLSARPRQELLREIGRAAAIVTTSRVEGMPNTFLEAWARGVPVLSLHVDPDARIAEHGVGIAAGGSMERFVEGAAALWRDAGLRRELGENARRFVRETHSPTAVADRWAGLLRKLLPPSGG
jgi:glycosyltransferase involved in cell wall biosynthesis